MDVSFSAKPQILIYSSLSSSSHFRLATSLRREFLGCHQLRPPGIRSRRRSRELGLRALSHRCLFRAYVNGKVVVAAAVVVATFAVLRVIYLNYTSLRDAASKLSDPELPDVLATLESKQDNTMEHGVFKSDTVAIGSTCTESFMEEKGDVRINCENVDSKKYNASDVNEVQPLKSQTTVLACEDNITAKLSKHHVYEVPTYSPSENVFSTGEIGLSQSEMVTETAAVEQDSLIDAIPETFLGNQEEVAVSKMCQIITESTLSGSTVPVSNICTESNLENELNNGISEEGDLQVLTSDSFFPQFAKEVSTSEEEKSPDLRSLFDCNSTSTTPSYITLQEKYSYSSPTKPLLKGTEILPKDSPLATEERVRFVCYKKGSRGNGEDTIKFHGPKHNIGRRQIHRNDVRGLSRLPQLNGISFNDAKDPSLQLRTYNRLLRDGRLIDCIELLESMEKMGILDMDKVYHARFLKTCKSQKAVKEAFHFTKLIKKPTLSTFNMLLSICASSQDSEGAYQVLLLVKEAGLKPDCQLYTTLISTCAKSGKVDAMFEVFHEMVNAGVEPNAHTYGALIDGCARAGQVAKAFGAYGIMRSKKVKPDRVVFNALITACGQSGAVDRAFDVLAEMTAEPQPIKPDHVTIGALMRTCAQAGQADRAREVYRMLQQYYIKGDADVYTIAVRGCSQTGDLEFALSTYDDMIRNGVVPDEMFISTLVDVAGHAGKVDVAFEILQGARIKGIQLGEMSYSSLMGACSNAKSWQKALELHEKIKAIKLTPTTSTLNALVTSLCDGDQLLRAVEVLDEMKEAGVHPNTITYSILLVSCEKKDEVELSFNLLSQAKVDGVRPNLIMCRCLTGLCLRRFEKAYSLGESILSFNSGKPQIDSKWTSWAIMMYRETIQAGVIPTIEVFSQVLGCLQFPRDSSLRNRFVENLGLSLDTPSNSKLYSLLDGFGEYDSRSFSILEEASSLGVVPCVSFKEIPIVVDARKLQIHTVEVYILTVLKGLRHRLASGARLPTVTILLPIEKTRISSIKGEKTINLAGRIGQTVGALLRRLGLPYQGDESYGKVRINGLALRRWFKPKIGSLSFGWKQTELTSTQARLAKGIIEQQRSIRNSNNLSLE